MAEGVKIPEKNAGFWRFGPPIGGGGPPRSEPVFPLSLSRQFPFSQQPVDRWQTVCSNGWAFITPLNIGSCIDMLYPVDRWNECEGV
jgi:hypothetical protein